MGHLAVPWQQAYRIFIFKTHMEVQSTEGELVLGFISRLSVDTYTAISGLSISAVHESSPCGRRAPPNDFNFLLLISVVKLDLKTTPTLKQCEPFDFLRCRSPLLT